VPGNNPPISRILLVRHGQSTWNADGRWQGREDPPLSTLGVRQARMAAESLGSFDLVAASTLARAHTTATIIADGLGIGPVVTDGDLVERHAGGFQGLTRPEIRERFPGYLDDGRRPPGWEADEDVVARVAGALARIAGRVGHGGTALVVTHGGVIHCLEEVAGVHRDGRMANLGGRWFDIGPGVLRGGEDVLLVDPEAATVPQQI
jgi:broad specificity phosphatase PhoE